MHACIRVCAEVGKFEDGWILHYVYDEPGKYMVRSYTNDNGCFHGAQPANKVLRWSIIHTLRGRGCMCANLRPFLFLTALHSCTGSRACAGTVQSVYALCILLLCVLPFFLGHFRWLEMDLVYTWANGGYFCGQWFLLENLFHRTGVDILLLGKVLK